MKQIWKFPLAVTDRQIIEMPMGADILCVQMQRDSVCLWALVNPERDKAERIIDIYGTGHNMDDDYHGYHIGTFQLNGGALVFHVFEAVP